VAVTGASSGIGLACARRLDRHGFRVFAGVLPGEDDRRLREEASERLRVVELDVTDSTAIAKAADAITAEVGEVGLVGLVNNAGISVLGPLEFLPLEALREQFEVNVIGQIAVTQAFLPLLRQGRGRVVMIGSAIGGLGVPLSGPYSASKSALRTLTAVLRSELRPWGIGVSIVMPGLVTTPIWDKASSGLDRILSQLPRDAQELYHSAAVHNRQSQEKSSTIRVPADVVAIAVEHALTARKPKTRYLVGRGARLAELLRAGPIPERLVDRFTIPTMHRREAKS